jgi:serine/threonine-protein kinase
VFSADGDVLDGKGPLRVVSLGAQKRSPVQLLITNDGLAQALITLSLRVDPPPLPTAPTPPVEPEQPPAPTAPAGTPNPAPPPAPDSTAN